MIGATAAQPSSALDALLVLLRALKLPAFARYPEDNAAKATREEWTFGRNLRPIAAVVNSASGDAATAKPTAGHRAEGTAAAWHTANQLEGPRRIVGKVRGKVGLSQDDFARAFGVSVGTLRK